MKEVDVRAVGVVFYGLSQRKGAVVLDLVVSQVEADEVLVHHLEALRQRRAPLVSELVPAQVQRADVFVVLDGILDVRSSTSHTYRICKPLTPRFKQEPLTPSPSCLDRVTNKTTRGYVDQSEAAATAAAFKSQSSEVFDIHTSERWETRDVVGR